MRTEKEHYSVHGGDFGEDEEFYRLGFESALHAHTRCKEYDQTLAEVSVRVGELERQYPGRKVAEPFARATAVANIISNFATNLKPRRSSGHRLSFVRLTGPGLGGHMRLQQSTPKITAYVRYSCGKRPFRLSSEAGMPEKETVERAREDAREGKSPSTQAGEFVREEIHHVREGKHGVRSARQAIAIGLSKARRAGVKVRPPRKGSASARTRSQAARDYSQGQDRTRRKISSTRSRAVTGALKKEGRSAATRRSLSRQAQAAARKRRRAVRAKGQKRHAQPNRDAA